MMKALTATAAMTFGLLAGIGAAHAQDQAPETEPPKAATAEAPFDRWTFEIGAGQVSLDEDFAIENGIGDSLWEVGAAAQYWFTPNVGATASFALAKMDDNNQVSQPVCPIFNPNCDPEEEESEEIGGAFSLGLEGRMALGEHVVGMVDGGYRYINFSRAIANCYNCEGGDAININGTYAGVGVGFRTNGGMITLRYRQAFGDELNGSMIHVGYQF